MLTIYFNHGLAVANPHSKGDEQMSVVIVGGNERMERQYSDLCKKYSCKAKVFTKVKGAMRNIGSPDLIVLFTNTVSHKMLHSLETQTNGHNIKIARCNSSSITALRGVLDNYIGGEIRV